MSFKVCEILVYGYEQDPERIILNRDGMSIVVGEEGTGKTTLIRIIDYCLASSKCNIPRGLIRDNTSWFALILSDGERSVYVARRTPPREKKSSPDFVLIQPFAGEAPLLGELIPNTSYEGALKSLSVFSGIEEYTHEPAAYYTRPNISPRVKHAVKFCLQPQNLLSNPNLLFYRQEEEFVPQSIRDTFPYFVGAITGRHLVMTARLKEKERELRKLTRQSELVEANHESTAALGESIVITANELGLRLELEDSETGNERIRAKVEAIAFSSFHIGHLRDGGLQDTARKKYEALLDLENRILNELRFVKGELRDAEELLSRTARYKGEGGEQLGRLQATNLFEQFGDTNLCPLCGSHVLDVPSVNELRSEMFELASKLSQVGNSGVAIQELISQLEKDVSQKEEEVVRLRRRMNSLRRVSRDVEAHRDVVARVAALQGMAKMWLQTSYTEPSFRTEREVKIEILNSEVEVLREELSNTKMNERLESSLSFINQRLEKQAALMGLEHSEKRIRFSLQRLTLVFEDERESLSLSQIGSGANWVGYHVALHIALHDYLAEIGAPVPRLLVIDQPSQISPKHTPGDFESMERIAENAATTRRIWNALNQFAERRGSSMQILLLEHPVEDLPDWFDAAVVERWGDKNRLIPSRWINS